MAGSRRVDHRPHAVLGHEARQVGGRAEGPPVDLGEPEGGVVGGHHDVGVAGQAHAATETEAVDGGDDGNLALVDGGEGGEAAPVGPDQRLVPTGLDLLDVHAGAEAPALGPEDDDPVVGHPAGSQYGFGQTEPAGHVEGVDRRVVDDHFGDTGSVLTGGDGHGRLRRSAARPRARPDRGTAGARSRTLRARVLAPTRHRDRSRRFPI